MYSEPDMTRESVLEASLVGGACSYFSRLALLMCSHPGGNGEVRDEVEELEEPEELEELEELEEFVGLDEFLDLEEFPGILC